MKRIENLHLIEYVRKADGEEITINRLVKDEDWFKELNAVMEKYNAVYVRANHHTRLLDNGCALTTDGRWVKVRTKAQTSMKISNLEKRGEGYIRKVSFSSEALADRMLKVFRNHQQDICKTDERTIEIPYRWNVLSTWEIKRIYTEVRAFF